MIVKCATCGKELHRKPSQVNTHKNHYCGKICHDADCRKGSHVECFWCGKRFYRSPSLIRERNFCAQDCRLAWFAEYDRTVMNVAGHSAGHKAPHLSLMNQLRNPAGSLYANTTYVRSAIYRRIMEKAIGRRLGADEIVHHVNGDRTDNRLENLRIMDKKEHRRLHMRIAIRRYNTGRDEKMSKDEARSRGVALLME